MINESNQPVYYRPIITFFAERIGGFMESFGELLKKHMLASGLNILQYAKLTGVDRNNIQRYLNNKRTPSAKTFHLLLQHLQLRTFDKEELETAYAVNLVGADIYYQRLYIKELLENFSVIYENERRNQSYDYSGSHIMSPGTDGQIHSIQGRNNILHIFQSELNRTVDSHTKPVLSIFLPPEPGLEYLNHVLTSVANPGKRTLQITQILYLVKSTSDILETQNHNLKILATSLSLSFSTQFLYDAYFYYDNFISNTNEGLLYPYHAIFNDSLLLFSQDFESAVLCKEPQLFHIYSRQFQSQLNKCRCFSRTSSRLSDLLLAVLENQSATQYECWLEYSPCILSVGNAELARTLLRDDLEHREAFLAQVIARIEQVQTLSEVPYHFFSEQGLIDFLDTGTCLEFPLSYVKVIPMEYRLIFLEKLLEVCVNDKQLLRIINPDTLKLSDYLSISLTDSTVNVYNFINDSEWNMITIPETGVYHAFLDFILHLPESRYLYSKKETIAILEKYINETKIKLENISVTST